MVVLPPQVEPHSQYTLWHWSFDSIQLRIQTYNKIIKRSNNFTSLSTTKEMALIFESFRWDS
jgi:hypothetical protein